MLRRIGWSVVLLALAACASVAERASHRDLSGEWVFEVPTGRAVVHGALTLVAEGDGYGGRLTTDQGDTVMAVRSLTLTGPRMRMMVASPNGDVIFEGTLAEGDVSFEGEVTYHNGQVFPMTGRRRPSQ
jgi:hypothetical protein